MFPSLTAVKNPASRISAWMPRVREQVPVLNEGYQPTMFRIGAANVLARSPHIILVMLIIFGGWSAQSMTTAFHYILQSDESVLYCGRLLSGWDLRYPVCSSKITFERDASFMNFSRLFRSIRPVLVGPQDSLRPVIFRGSDCELPQAHFNSKNCQ